MLRKIRLYPVRFCKVRLRKVTNKLFKVSLGHHLVRTS